MNKRYFYISLDRIKKASTVLNYGVFDEPLEGGHPFPDAYLYVSDHLPGTLIWDEKAEEVREATEFDLYKLGRRQLHGVEFIHNDEILNINNFPIPSGIYKPVFNYETLTWEEGLTQEEIDAIKLVEYLKFYNTELEYASKARVEFDVELITEADYNEVRAYIRAINPYSVDGKPTVKPIVMARPNVFNRYNF